MPTIPVAISSYPSPYSARNGTYSWRISQMRLEYAVISVGLTNFANAFSSVSAAQLSWGKAYCASSACDWSRTTLVTPSSYRFLDQSDKTNLSFWLGMAFAKIAAQRILGIGTLEHAASLRRARILRVLGTAGGSLADLVGCDPSGAWHVFEAKGRARPPDAGTQASWKAQAQTITHVNGVAVSTSSRCLVTTGGRYRLEVVDPDTRKLPRYSIDLDWEAAKSHKTRSIQGFLEGGDVQELGSGLVRARQVGFDPRTNSNVYLGISDQPQEAVVMSDSELTFVGADGISLSYIGGDIVRMRADLESDIDQEFWLPNEGSSLHASQGQQEESS